MNPASPAAATAPTPAAPLDIGVGFDTARYGHHVAFLRPDRQPAAKAFTFTESPAGYQQLRQALDQLVQRHGQVHFHMRVDAAGQYATNLERFLRSLPYAQTISIGEPKRNRDYCKVHFPKRKADPVESQACARFAIVERPPATPATPPLFQELRDVASALQSQVKQRTRLTNQLHNRLARVFPELAVLTPQVATGWVLRLLERYPTPAKIAAARPTSLTAIPHLTEEKAAQVQAAAGATIASFQGPMAAELIRHSAQAVRHSQQSVARLKTLLVQAYDALPPSPHRHLESIPGIGKQTAAALVAKVIDIDRFATPDDLVGYFGIFPEENSSGVDKFGHPVPPGTMCMSRKGNDLARAYLWNAAKTAILHNPTIRALYARQRAKGKRGAVALGHCMRKLLHLVFVVWKTNQPYAAPEIVVPAETPPLPVATAAAPLPTPAVATPAPVAGNEKAVGRTGQSPERQAVTTAPAIVPPADAPGNTANSSDVPRPALPTPGPRADCHHGPIDFAWLREHLTIEQVLRELDWCQRLHGTGPQRRGPCPIHGSLNPRSRSFSVHLQHHVFQCFHPSCAAHGNALDLWVQARKLPLYQAALDLMHRLNLFPSGTEKRNP